MQLSNVKCISFYTNDIYKLLEINAMCNLKRVRDYKSPLNSSQNSVF